MSRNLPIVAALLAALTMCAGCKRTHQDDEEMQAAQQALNQRAAEARAQAENARPTRVLTPKEVRTAQSSAKRAPALPPANVRPSELRAAQLRLIDLGYLAPPADGVFGPRTADAVKRFQASANLPTTGELTVTTMERLDDASAFRHFAE